ncbi:dihydroxyacetone kinase phosphoryl donor subunit DhaM [Arthrobacter bambusae]|uniref:dihydroxyacetone kinase phosphoryl donor subunit DhaM n=1 Tax=Arthrobacter bambusae TaxID=1338426 RepID=UPI002780CE62|nr:dihydroxyacetone kinase phosphoryl donor subunit DhaM [Arthrobacter bambusae]MDQ0030773.1 PTS hybrid protein [Arthrobacter bambusae]MDQ0098940.1 PTS hybrid protein [Arthrobacter bambusae]
MTVGLVVISHSPKIAEGAVELAAQMAPDVRFYPVGGTDDGRIGTDLEKTVAAFETGLGEASGDGVVVLTDLGSAVMTAESAAEFCSEPEKVFLADAPLVEGLVAAAVAAQGGAAAAAAKAAAEAVRFGPEPAFAASGSMESQGKGEPTESGEFELINPMGMHARPAAKIAGGLAGLDVEATVNGVDGTSIMELMTLAVGKGGKLRVEAWGNDASKAVDYVRRLVEEGFGEI